MINRDFLYYSRYEIAASLKFAADETNTSYKVGFGGDVHEGEPLIAWTTQVFIGDTRQMWLRGNLISFGVVVDESLSSTSSNPVQNKAINTSLNLINNAITSMRGQILANSNNNDNEFRKAKDEREKLQQQIDYNSSAIDQNAQSIAETDTHIAETNQLISALSSLVQHLTDIGLVNTQYQFAFLEETNMERLTADQMSEMIIYAGLEEEEEQPSQGGSIYDPVTSTLTIGGVLDGTALTVAGKYNESTKTLTL